jgi:hypothetical protein
MLVSSELSFVKPSEKPELNGEVGLTLHEIAKSLQVNYADARKKLERMIESNRIKSSQEYASFNDFTKLETRCYALPITEAKFFVAKYNNEIGDAYTRFLIACEGEVIRRVSKLHPADEFAKYHSLAGLLGLKAEQAAIHANHATRKKTGDDVLALMEYKVTTESRTMSLSKILQGTDISSRKGNQILSNKGFIAKDSNGVNWVLTPKGIEAGGKLVSQEFGGKMRQSIEWTESILDYIAD